MTEETLPSGRSCFEEKEMLFLARSQRSSYEDLLTDFLT